MMTLNRRDFLTSTLAAGVLAACSSTKKQSSPNSSSANSSATTAAADGAADAPTPAGKVKSSPKAAAVDKRRLVIIEMDGGNDGLSTLVPYGMTGYKDVRSRVAIDPKELLALNDQMGLIKTLAPLQTRGLAVVQGIGTPNPDGSHFAMMDRWWTGDLRGEAKLTTGFLCAIHRQWQSPGAPVREGRHAVHPESRHRQRIGRRQGRRRDPLRVSAGVGRHGHRSQR
jgi:hypothetical protein